MSGKRRVVDGSTSNDEKRRRKNEVRKASEEYLVFLDTLAFSIPFGQEETAERVLPDDVEPNFQRESDGRSLLAAAARIPSISLVSALLLKGAPWNALDKNGMSPGEHALNAGSAPTATLVMNAGVASELVFSAASGKTSCLDSTTSNCDTYLSERVNYSKDGTKLIDQRNDGELG